MNNDPLDIFDLSDEEMMDLLDITDEEIVILKLKHGKGYRKGIGTTEQLSKAIAKKLGFKNK